MDIFSCLAVCVLAASIVVIAVGIVILIVRLGRMNAALEALLHILDEKGVHASKDESAEAEIAAEDTSDESAKEELPSIGEAETQDNAAAVNEKIVLKPLPYEEKAPEEEQETPALEGDAPREPSQFQLRLSALRNWFIYGKAEGVGEDDSREKMLATTWLLRCGILVLLFSSAFLLKLSMERGLLGPEGRVALSYLCGAALLCGGLHGKLRENYWSLGQALAGIGLGTLYFSSFAMVSMYSLTPVHIGFAVMTLVTLTAGFLADKLASLPIALVSLVGGYATPLMLSTGQKNIPGLAGYLLLLGCGVLWLSNRRNWQQLNVLGIVFTYGIFLLVFAKQFAPDDFAAYQTGLALFMLLFSTSVFIHNLRERKPATELEIIGLLMNSGIFFGESMLAIRRTWPDERLMAAPLTLGLSMLYLLHTLLFNRLRRAEYRNLLLAFCALSALFLSLTFPAVLTGHWLGAAWALEALVLLWLSGKLSSPFIRGCSWLLYLCTMLRLVAYEFSFYGGRMTVEAGQGFWGGCLARCCQFLIPVICLALGAKITIGQQALQAEAQAEASEHESCRCNLGLGFAASGLFFTLAYALGFVFLRLELGAVLNHSLPGFALAGINLAWVSASILALVLLDRNVPGWWKWIFSVAAPIFILCCITDFFDSYFWSWPCIYGSIANTLILASGIWYATRKLRSGHFPRQVALLGSILWPLLLFVHGTREVQAIVWHKLPGLSGGGVSLLWAIFAFALVIRGLRGSLRTPRYIGLLLFAVVVVKVFFWDVSNLDAVYRVLAFLAFGILLLGAAFVYLKFWRAKETQK